MLCAYDNQSTPQDMKPYGYVRWKHRKSTTVTCRWKNERKRTMGKNDPKVWIWLFSLLLMCGGQHFSKHFHVLVRNIVMISDILCVLWLENTPAKMLPLPGNIPLVVYFLQRGHSNAFSNKSDLCNEDPFQTKGDEEQRKMGGNGKRVGENAAHLVVAWEAGHGSGPAMAFHWWKVVSIRVTILPHLSHLYRL